jgi:hypothetical protein
MIAVAGDEKYYFDPKFGFTQEHFNRIADDQ